MKFSPESEIVLEISDLYGTIVRFEKKNYDKHKQYHPELRQKQFCPGQIAMALQKPTFVIKGNHPDTLCYYLELFRVRDIIKYAKVVVREADRLDKGNPHCIIKTAFKTDHVQELAYGFAPMHYN